MLYWISYAMFAEGPKNPARRHHGPCLTATTAAAAYNNIYSCGVSVWDESRKPACLCAQQQIYKFKQFASIIEGLFVVETTKTRTLTSYRSQCQRVHTRIPLPASAMCARWPMYLLYMCIRFRGRRRMSRNDNVNGESIKKHPPHHIINFTVSYFDKSSGANGFRAYVCIPIPVTPHELSLMHLCSEPDI